MSLQKDINLILKRLSENANALDESTKNIANATPRIAYEVAKGQSLHSQYKLPKEKYERIIDFTQSVANICSNFVPPKPNDEANNDGDIDEKFDAATDAARFQHFVTRAEKQIDEAEKQIIKLGSLRDVINHISEQ